MHAENEDVLTSTDGREAEDSGNRALGTKF